VRVLAIDPGSRRMGWAVMEGDHELVAYGLLDFTSKAYSDRFLGITQAMSALWRHYHPDEVAMERPFKSLRCDTSALIVAVRCVKDCCQRLKPKLPVYLYAPGQWKKSAAGQGNATKDDVARCISLLYPQLPPDLANDITDAIGIGGHHMGIRKLEGMAK